MKLLLTLLLVVVSTTFLSCTGNEVKAEATIEAAAAPAVDSVALQVAQEEVDKLKSKFLKQEDEFNKVTWYTHKTFGKHWPNRSTLVVKVRNDGASYLQSNLYGKEWLWHNKVTVLAKGVTYESPAVSLIGNNHVTDNTAYEIWEVNQYAETGDNNIMQFIAANKDDVVKVRFHGKDFHKDVTLSKADKAAIAESVAYANALSILNK